jgi:GntR family transcriptional regulator
MEFDANIPIYRQIGDFVCDSIIQGTLSEGEKIPSVREMAMRAEVNPNTVMRTYADLQEQGIIFNKRGIGYFVAEDAPRVTRWLKREEFVEHELPTIFRKMDILEMTLTDLQPHYDQYLAERDNNGSKESEMIRSTSGEEPAKEEKR